MNMYKGINRTSLWTYIVIMILFSFYTNASSLVAILRLREKRTSTDVLIGGVSMGILIAGLGCFPQCFSSLILNEFAFGEGMNCWLESFFHVIGLQTQFFGVGAIAYRTYVGVVKLQHFSQEKAIKILTGIGVVSLCGTAVFGSISPYKVSASGTFCLYQWNAPALYAWAGPTAILSALLMAFWYWQTFTMVRKVRIGAKELQIDGSRRDAEIALKLASLVFLFVFGYIVFAFLIVYETAVGPGHESAPLDVAAVVPGLLYWAVMPLAYGYANSRLGWMSAMVWKPMGSASDRYKSTSGVKEMSRARTEMSARSMDFDETGRERDENPSPLPPHPLSPTQQNKSEGSLDGSTTSEFLLPSSSSPHSPLSPPTTPPDTVINELITEDNPLYKNSFALFSPLPENSPRGRVGTEPSEPSPLPLPSLPTGTNFTFGREEAS